MDSGKLSGEKIANNDQEEQGNVALGEIRDTLGIADNDRQLTWPPQPKSKFSRERVGRRCLRRDMCEVC